MLTRDSHRNTHIKAAAELKYREPAEKYICS